MSFIDDYQRMSVNALRDEVINLLKEAYADGRIRVETLERRLREATTASTKGALMDLVADIPSGETGNTERKTKPESKWHTNDRAPRDSETFFAVLSGANRTGRWQPARQITCFSLMGGVKLDFRDAEFPGDRVTIHALCIMGGLDIILPPGVNADVSGLPLLGGFDNKAGGGDPDAPTVVVRGLTVMGGVDVKRKELRRR